MLLKWSVQPRVRVSNSAVRRHLSKAASISKMTRTKVKAMKLKKTLSDMILRTACNVVA